MIDEIYKTYIKPLESASEKKPATEETKESSINEVSPSITKEKVSVIMPDLSDRKEVNIDDINL